MTKKHFISLANAIKWHNSLSHAESFTERQINVLADWCREQNSRFNQARWFDYIMGKCGPNGGTIKGK